jgi:uncharacterized protein (DUF1684 family)
VSYEDEIEAWRARRVAALAAPDGWLSLVGLFWLREGRNAVGSDPSSDVILPEDPAPAQLGSIQVASGRATAVFPPGSGVRSGDEEVSSLLLEDDPERPPTVLALGSLRFHVISRGGALAVRVRDLDSPARRSMTRIPNFPIDARWRVNARFDPHDSARQAVLPTVVGPGQEYRIMGALRLELAGQPLSLEAYQELDESDLFIVFGDETNGRETYEGGRYLYASPPEVDELVTLDFNRAYNPPCVFTPYSTCVLALPDNRLPVRIEAGEMKYRPSG